MKIIFSFLVLLFAQFGFAQNIMYVQAGNAKIKAEPKGSAADIKAVARGQKLTVLETQGNWLKVQSDKDSGWISKLFVSAVKPVGADDAAGLNDVSPEKMSRKRSANYSVSASTRGLTASSRNRANQEKYRPNVQAVEKLENEKIADEEINKFNKEGGIHGEK